MAKSKGLYGGQKITILPTSKHKMARYLQRLEEGWDLRTFEEAIDLRKGLYLYTIRSALADGQLLELGPMTRSQAMVGLRCIERGIGIALPRSGGGRGTMERQLLYALKRGVVALFRLIEATSVHVLTNEQRNLIETLCGVPEVTSMKVVKGGIEIPQDLRFVKDSKHRIAMLKSTVGAKKLALKRAEERLATERTSLKTRKERLDDEPDPLDSLQLH